MSIQRAHLKHDLSALYGFIECIAGGEKSRGPSAAYGPAATDFLKFISELAVSCKDYIESWDVADEDEYEDRRVELSTIRAAWQELHSLIKPARDADTLDVPSAVVDGIVRRFQQLSGCEKTKFALFHTSEFNYVEVRTADLGNIASKLRRIVPHAPPFLENLGLIGIPYSQGKTAFANCLIAHEIGHYLYRQLSVENTLRQDVDTALSNSVRDYHSTDQSRQDWMVKTVIRWCEELFCDLFGLHLLGPCYTCAYVEAYDLYSVLDHRGDLSEERISPKLDFYEKHPSHMYRLQQQAIFLRESPWWDKIDGFSVRFAKLLSALVNSQHKASTGSPIGNLVPALDRCVPAIKNQLGRAFDGIDDGFTEFQQLNSTVQTYLSLGIVPSSLVVRTESKPTETQILPVSPFVLLNAGMQFYLTQVDSLIKSIDEENLDKFPKRIHWIRRVEEWIAKAIEDQSLETDVSDGNNNRLGNQTAAQA